MSLRNCDKLKTSLQLSRESILDLSPFMFIWRLINYFQYVEDGNFQSKDLYPISLISSRLMHLPRIDAFQFKTII